MTLKKYKFLGICKKGLEDISKLEIPFETKIISGAVLFECTLEQAVKTIYYAQTFSGFMRLLPLPYKMHDTFAVRANSKELEIEAASMIKGGKVDLSDPKIHILAHKADKIYIGIDLVGFDLSKRDYRINPSSNTLNASYYGALAVLASKNKGTVLDPYAKCAIEAACKISNKSVNHHRKKEFLINDFEKIDQDIDMTQKVFCFGDARSIKKEKMMAKVAGINKAIRFGTVMVRDLDMKFSKGEIGTIISQPPQTGRIRPDYKELFYQAQYILSDSGSMILISINDQTKKRLVDATKDFTLEKEYKNNEISILIFKKSTKKH